MESPSTAAPTPVITTRSPTTAPATALTACTPRRLDRVPQEAAACRAKAEQLCAKYALVAAKGVFLGWVRCVDAELAGEIPHGQDGC